MHSIFPPHVGRPHGAFVVEAAFKRGSEFCNGNRGYHFEVFTTAGTFGPDYPEMEGEVLVLAPPSDNPVLINPADVVAIKVVMV